MRGSREKAQGKRDRSQSQNRIVLSKPTQQYKRHQVRICKKLFDDNSESSGSDSDSSPFSPVLLPSTAHKNISSNAKKILDTSSDDDSLFSHANTSVHFTPASPPNSITRSKKTSALKQTEQNDQNILRDATFCRSQSKPGFETGKISRCRSSRASDFHSDSDSSNDQTSNNVNKRSTLIPTGLERSKSINRTLSLKSIRRLDKYPAKSKLSPVHGLPGLVQRETMPQTEPRNKLRAEPEQISSFSAVRAIIQTYSLLNLRGNLQAWNLFILEISGIMVDLKLVADFLHSMHGDGEELDELLRCAFRAAET